jgi:hypothetical protein
MSEERHLARFFGESSHAFGGETAIMARPHDERSAPAARRIPPNPPL